MENNSKTGCKGLNYTELVVFFLQFPEKFSPNSLNYLVISILQPKPFVSNCALFGEVLFFLSMKMLFFLCAAGSLIAFPPICEPLKTEDFPAAFNRSASIDTPNHLFMTGSFLYWYAVQEGMDLAITATMQTSGSKTLFLALDSVPLFQAFRYSPALKVGLGWNFSSDRWVILAEYTRLRQHTRTFSKTFASDLPPGTGVGEWVMTGWYLQTANSSSQSLAASQINSKWSLGLDFIDVSLSRPYYEGRKWRITPIAGLRGVLIREMLHIASLVMNATPPKQPVVSRNKSQSWGIGPNGGVQTNGLLDYGLRLQADCGGSILFTQYTTVSHQEDPGDAGDNLVGAHLRNYNCLRPVAEGGLGLGWSRYWKTYHFDLSASYDFTILWSQNMMRALLELNRAGIGLSPQNLYLHGLTCNARFDF